MTQAPPISPQPAVGPMPPAGPAPIPAPPQGPGVFPPFPAPPIEGRGLRVGLGLGIGGAVLLLVCGGGIAAVAGLVTVTGRALNEQAHVVVGDYFKAVQEKRYAEAYDSQCQDAKDSESQAEFTSRFTRSSAITSYQVGDVDLASVDLSVPVDVTYSDGDSGTLHVYLGRSKDTGEFQVCGVEE
jgi:hypothetical protein